MSSATLVILVLSCLLALACVQLIRLESGASGVGLAGSGSRVRRLEAEDAHFKTRVGTHSHHHTFDRNSSCEPCHQAAVATDSVTQKKKTKVVVFIPSKISSAGRRLPVNRQFAREKWSSQDVIILWVIGTRTGDHLETALDTSDVLKEEYMTTENVFFSDCRDDGDEPNNVNGTSSTTCKFLEALRYMDKYYEADYAIRGADDAYLNIRKFLAIQNEFPRDALWLGQLRDQSRNFDLSLKTQPNLAKLYGLTHMSTNYMLGMGFVFSWDIVALIGRWNVPVHDTWCEDVMVGMYLNVFRLHRVNRPDLFVNRGGSVANRWYLDGTYGSLDVILLHYIQEEDWHHIDDNGIIHIPGPK